MDLWSKYLSKLDIEQVASVKNIRKLVEDIEPTAENALPYGVPGYKYKGKNLIAFAAHKKHFGVYPFSPAIVKEIVKEHPKISFAQGTLRFSYKNLPSKELIKKIIELRKKEIIN